MAVETGRSGYMYEIPLDHNANGLAGIWPRMTIWAADAMIGMRGVRASRAQEVRDDETRLSRARADQN